MGKASQQYPNFGGSAESMPYPSDFLDAPSSDTSFAPLFRLDCRLFHNPRYQISRCVGLCISRMVRARLHEEDVVEKHLFGGRTRSAQRVFRLRRRVAEGRADCSP